MEDRLRTIEGELAEVRTTLGEAPNPATGAPGSGMQLVLARLAEGQAATTRRIAAFVAVLTVLLEMARLVVPWAPASTAAASPATAGASR
jgi:hypothetical protein